MPSKKEKFCSAAQSLPIFQCVTCSRPMTLCGDTLRCEGGHCVNIHRKGCVNMLSRPVEGCYDAQLFDARSRVFSSGCYTPVADALDEMLCTLRPGVAHTLLDAGCGEGWYLNALLARHPAWQGAGVDISRDAIFRATDHPCAALWCVADLRRLPMKNGSFTCVLDILTPAGYDEFSRVLAPGGILLKVYPGSDYLREVRQARGIAPYEEGRVDAYLREKGRVLMEKRVHYAVPASPMLWRDFVYMTPLNQDLDAQEKQALAQAIQPHVTIDLHLAAVTLPHEGGA